MAAITNLLTMPGTAMFCTPSCRPSPNLLHCMTAAIHRPLPPLWASRCLAVPCEGGTWPLLALSAVYLIIYLLNIALHVACQWRHSDGWQPTSERRSGAHHHAAKPTPCYVFNRRLAWQNAAWAEPHCTGPQQTCVRRKRCSAMVHGISDISSPYWEATISTFCVLHLSFSPFTIPKLWHDTSWRGLPHGRTTRRPLSNFTQRTSAFRDSTFVAVFIMLPFYTFVSLLGAVAPDGGPERTGPAWLWCAQHRRVAADSDVAKTTFHHHDLWAVAFADWCAAPLLYTRWVTRRARRAGATTTRGGRALTAAWTSPTTPP